MRHLITAALLIILGNPAGASPPPADVEKLKTLSPDLAATLICTDTELRSVQRDYRIQIRVSEFRDGRPVCVTKEIVKTATVRVKGALLSLNAVEQLTTETAEVLSRHKGFLDLNGLKSLPPELAKAFTAGDLTLSLDGLETISHESADALVRRGGGVSLHGLTKVSLPTFETLRVRGWGPNSITVEGARDRVVNWKDCGPASFSQYSQRLSEQLGMRLTVDEQVFAKHQLDVEQPLPAPPLMVMQADAALFWLASAVSKDKPGLIVPERSDRDHVHFTEATVATPRKGE